MTKAVSRAMDAITEYVDIAAHGELATRRFVVGGASKRGWTMWTTGLADARCVGVYTDEAYFLQETHPCTQSPVVFGRLVFAVEATIGARSWKRCVVSRSATASLITKPTGRYVTAFRRGVVHLVVDC